MSVKLDLTFKNKTGGYYPQRCIRLVQSSYEWQAKIPTLTSAADCELDGRINDVIWGEVHGELPAITGDADGEPAVKGIIFDDPYILSWSTCWWRERQLTGVDVKSFGMSVIHGYDDGVITGELPIGAVTIGWKWYGEGNVGCSTLTLGVGQAVSASNATEPNIDGVERRDPDGVPEVEITGARGRRTHNEVADVKQSSLSGIGTFSLSCTDGNERIKVSVFKQPADMLQSHGEPTLTKH